MPQVIFSNFAIYSGTSPHCTAVDLGPPSLTAARTPMEWGNCYLFQTSQRHNPTFLSSDQNKHLSHYSINPPKQKSKPFSHQLFIEPPPEALVSGIKIAFPLAIEASKSTVQQCHENYTWYQKLSGHPPPVCSTKSKYKKHRSRVALGVGGPRKISNAWWLITKAMNGMMRTSGHSLRSPADEMLDNWLGIANDFWG